MKVLQICAAYKPAFVYGGPTMSVSMLSEQLVKAGVFTAVYATTANGKSELPVLPGKAVNVDGVPVIYFERVTGDHTHFSPRLLRALWKQAPEFNLIHIHAWWNLVSIFSCLIAIIRGVPVLVSPRGTLSPYSFHNKNIGVKWIMHNVLGKFLLNRSHIHVTSQRECEAINGLIHPKSITIIPNFVKLVDQKALVQSTSASPIKLIFFSRIEAKKGLDILINALAMVTVPFHLTIAGDGNPDYITSLKTMAIDNRVDDKITWAGFRGSDKFELLQQHDLFVLPSHDENFGNTVIESLSVGTPVLISEHVGLADYVKQKNFGWICQTSPASVSNAINDIAQNHSAEITYIKENAPVIIADDFNETKLVKRYTALYHQLTS